MALTAGLFLLELTPIDTRGAADDQVPEDYPPFRQEIDGQAPGAPPAPISDARWVEYNRMFNELLMRRSD